MQTTDKDKDKKSITTKPTSQAEKKPSDNKDKSKGKGDTDWQKQAEEYLAGWQRAQADYLNLKREMEEKIAQLKDLAKADVLLEFLPIYNNLISAFEHIPDQYQQENWAVGFAHIRNQLDKFLTDQGISRIDAVGQKFDPQIYEAVEVVYQADKEDDEIIKEVVPGYKLGDKILIHPKVVVNKADKQDNEQNNDKKSDN